MLPFPILLIHGFNGYPSNWTGRPDQFPAFLARQGFDPDLIRVFDYGTEEYRGQPIYRNTDDFREVAQRLSLTDPNDPGANCCSVDLLSRASLARGGPAEVTLIAHSSGGLVARYYLSRRSPDEFGTVFRGNVSRLIMLGTPHRGVDLLDILDPLPATSLLYRLMAQFHILLPPEYSDQLEKVRAEMRGLGKSARQGLLGDVTNEDEAKETPAFRQMHAGSAFLNEINRPGAMPSGISYHNIVGDIRAGICIQLFRGDLGLVEQSLGDFLVSTASASSLPNAPSDCYPIVQQHYLEFGINRSLKPFVQLAERGEHLAPIHRNLRHHPAARKRVQELLAAARSESAH